MIRASRVRRAAAAVLALAAAWLAAAPVRAESTGEDRAREAGRALLGTPAPRFVRKTIDGETIDLGALYGKKAVYLKFWATWCVPCRQQMPHFQHVYETAGPDLAIVAIDVGFNDSVDAVRAYRKKLGITMPILFDDGSLGSAFRLRVTPTHIVVGRDGRIRYVGHLANADLDAALAAARGATAAPATRVAQRSAAAGDHPAVKVGDRLPPLALHTLDGNELDLGSSRAGQPSVLVFLSPWCESYLEESRPAASATCKRARLEVEDLAKGSSWRWLGIASGLWADAGDLRKYRDQYGVTLPLSLDASGAAFRAFRVNDVPTVVVANAEGHITRRIDAAGFEDADALRHAIEAAAEEAR